VGERYLFRKQILRAHRLIFLFFTLLHFDASQFLDNIIYDIEALVRAKLKVDIAEILKA